MYYKLKNKYGGIKLRKVEVFKHKDGTGAKSGRSKKYKVLPLDYVVDLELTDELDYVELAGRILNDRHVIRDGEGEYYGIDVNITDRDILNNLTRLFKARKNIEFIKLANVEVDIIIIAYQKTKDSLYVEALFEHYFSYIEHISKKYKYVAAGASKDDDSDFIAEAVIVLEQCMSRYKLGYFLPFFRGWLRHSLSEACRKKYFDLLAVPKPILRDMRSGLIDKPVRVVSSTEDESLYLNNIEDETAINEEDMIRYMSNRDRKLWDRVMSVAGENEGRALCYTEGIFTENEKKYTCKALAAKFGVSTSTIVRRKQKALQRLREDQYFISKYKEYMERRLFKTA